MHRVVEIAGVPVGDGHPTYIVFELGVCHEQDVELAEHFVETAARVGASAVKVESFQADELVMDRTMEHSYTTTSGPVTENYYALLKRLELSYDDYARVNKKADEVGVPFFPTVATNEAVDFMLDIGVCAFKLASPDIVNFPLLRYVAAKGLPVLLDTGGAFIGEVETALNTLAESGCEDVVVMHNPSGYPAPAEKTDLRMISAMKRLFDIPIGLSCHTPGFDMVVASIAIGANVVEKPISRSYDVASPEHIFSFLDTEAELFVEKVRVTETSLGRGRRVTVDDQSLPRYIGRRGLYAARDLSAGEIIQEDSILLAKPRKGISVEDIDQVVGKLRIRHDLPKHASITWAAVE